MLPFFWYMLKVIICSGILFAYYWLFLRNKIFHGYNRFYLLVAMMLSLLLPLLKINFWQPATQANQAIRVLQAVSIGDDYMSNVVVATRSNWSLEQLYAMAYWFVSIIFLLVMLRTLFLIRALLKQYPVQRIEDVAFVNTNHESTPFSFLKYIFWNSSIDINSTTGKQIFKHELAHIQQKHTHDKLFVNIILIFCWCNPFFWLYRKELNMIHEFIADKKAVEDSDTAAFSAMILQAAYPRYQFQLTNNFFYSPIKRRLLMLSKNKNPKANYIGRIMVLPLIVLVFAAFSLKAKNADSKPGTQFNVISNATNKSATLPLIDSLFKSVSLKKTIDTVPKKISENDLKEKKPLYILNGKEIDEKTLSAISPNDIESVNVIKDKDAIVKYGDKAKNGVVEVFLKKQLVVVSEARNPELMNDSIIYVYNLGYKERLGWKINNIDIPNKALYILNGKEVAEEIAAKIADKDVADITVIKPEEAIKDYSSKGVNGVVLINSNPGYQIRTWKADTMKFYRGEKISGVNKKMLVIVDDKFYYDKTLQQVADELGVTQFETILFLPAERAVARYGDKAKEGAVVVTLTKVKEAAINNNSNDFNLVNPEPKIYLGNNSGGKINLDYLKKVKEISVSGDITFMSGTLYISGPGFDKNVLHIQLRSASLSSVTTAFNRYKNGTQLVFDAVRVKDKNGDERTLQSQPPFIVYDKETADDFIQKN